MSSPPRSNIQLPEVEWKSSTCPVCGKTFDYLSRRRPRTCNTGECRYKYHFGVDRENWSGYQMGLFDRRE